MLLSDPSLNTFLERARVVVFLRYLPLCVRKLENREVIEPVSVRVVHVQERAKEPAGQPSRNVS